MQLKSFEQFNT